VIELGLLNLLTFACVRVKAGGHTNFAMAVK